MSNFDSLIYVLVSRVFHNIHFRHFGDLKMRFLIIRHRVLLSQWFWIYFFWDYKYLQRTHLSQCKLRLLEYEYTNTTFNVLYKHSNDVSLIYVIVSSLFHNVHFRHFGDLKMRFLLIRQRVLLSQLFWIYLCWDYK